MNQPRTITPQKICEKILIAEKHYNLEHHILPSENVIADRLLARGVELKDAYEELYDKLHPHPMALEVFLGLVLNTAAFWSPDKIKEARTSRNELANVNNLIARRSEELAALLEQRSELHNTSGFTSETYYHVVQVIEAASQENYLFQSHIQDKLRAIRGQYDFKYWPALSQLVRVIGTDADNNATAEATDPLTAAATTSLRPSKADFFKALFAAIVENSAENYGRLPAGFKLTDRTLASLANCALDLDVNDMVDEAYMKRLRQRERSRTC